MGGWLPAFVWFATARNRSRCICIRGASGFYSVSLNRRLKTVEEKRWRFSICDKSRFNEVDSIFLSLPSFLSLEVSSLSLIECRLSMQIAPDEKARARAAISKHGIKTSCPCIDNGGKKKRSDLSPTVTKRHSLRSGFIISRSTRALFQLPSLW